MLSGIENGTLNSTLSVGRVFNFSTIITIESDIHRRVSKITIAVKVNL